MVYLVAWRMASAPSETALGHRRPQENWTSSVFYRRAKGTQFPLEQCQRKNPALRGFWFFLRRYFFGSLRQRAFDHSREGMGVAYGEVSQNLAIEDDVAIA